MAVSALEYFWMVLSYLHQSSDGTEEKIIPAFQMLLRTSSLNVPRSDYVFSTGEVLSHLMSWLQGAQDKLNTDYIVGLGSNKTNIKLREENTLSLMHWAIKSQKGKLWPSVQMKDPKLTLIFQFITTFPYLTLSSNRARPVYNQG